MKSKALYIAFGAAFLASTCAAFAQGDGVSDPGSFPLAAKAGVNSHARDVAPPGAVNQGPFDMKKWKRGNRYDAPPGTPLWNPVMVKMMQGGKVTSVTIDGNDTPAHYCAAANSGVDFIWTEMQHSAGTWDSVQKMWSACPYAKAVPGVRIANANEFDEQHALDLGALWLEIPTVRSVAEAKEAIKWAFYPPMGERSQGEMTRAYANVPGGYRQTINKNLVLTLMIETLDGLKDADKIAALPGVTAVFAASGDLGNFGGYKQGDPDYEREINIVHDAALMANKRLCGPSSWINRADFTCFQGPGGHIDAPADADLNAVYAAATLKALGPLANTQGKVTAGPWAPGGASSKTADRGGR